MGVAHFDQQSVKSAQVVTSRGVEAIHDRGRVKEIEVERDVMPCAWLQYIHEPLWSPGSVELHELATECPTASHIITLDKTNMFQNMPR